MIIDLLFSNSYNLPSTGTANVKTKAKTAKMIAVRKNPTISVFEITIDAKR